jgi:hypothetical protein
MQGCNKSTRLAYSVLILFDLRHYKDCELFYDPNPGACTIKLFTAVIYGFS